MRKFLFLVLFSWTLTSVAIGQQGHGVGTVGIAEVGGILEITIPIQITFGAGETMNLARATNDSLWFFDSAGNAIRYENNNVDVFVVTDDGKVLIGPGTSPITNLDLAVAAGSNVAMDFQDGDVAHGMTAFLDPDVLTTTTGRIQTLNSSQGGLRIAGISDTNTGVGVEIQGIIGVAVPNDGTPAVVITGGRAAGTDFGSLTSTKTILEVRDTSGNPLVTFLAGGDVGFSTIAPQHDVSIYQTVPTLTLTDTDKNIITSSAAQAIDTSAVFLSVESNMGRVSVVSDSGETAYLGIIDGGANADTVVVQGAAGLVFRFGNNSLIVAVDGTVTASGNMVVLGNLSVSGTESKEGEFFWDENASATTMETANSPIGLRFATTGTELGFTFDAGSTGGITVFADGGGGTVDVTDVAHGLVTGDFVVIRGTTNYNGVFQITRIDDDNFTITDTWVSDDGASDWDEPSYLQLTAGTSEVFSLSWSMSIVKAGGGSIEVNPQAYLGTTAQTKSLGELTIAGSDTEPIASGQVIAMSAGNRLFFILKSTSTSDLTVKHGNVRLSQL